jgi:hypothetical protein
MATMSHSYPVAAKRMVGTMKAAEIIKCPQCHGDVLVGWEDCIHCSFVLPEAVAAPAKKRGGWIAAGLGVLVLFAVVSSGDDDDSGPGAASSVPLTHVVTYKVEGTTSQASITFANASGDTSQQSDIDVPLTRKSDSGEGLVLNGMGAGDFLYISAQNSKSSGSVTCAIEVDGIRVKENTSHGGYTIATCSGRL